jgi:hypothetical protein
VARYEIPNQLPEFVECGDAFIPSNEATLEEWQRHKNPDKSVNQILKLAGKLALPDNVTAVTPPSSIGWGQRSCFQSEILTPLIPCHGYATACAFRFLRTENPLTAQLRAGGT